MSINIRQLRAARALLDWSQKDLARHSGVSEISIINIEKGRTSPQIQTMDKILAAFDMAGVDFTDNDGVRMKPSGVHILRGPNGFREFMDDVHDVCSTQGGEVCVYNAKPANWTRWLGEDWLRFHTARMAEIADRLDYKITCQNGDRHFLGNTHAEYRWIPDELWDERTFYAYGDRIGFINFQDDGVDVFILRQKQFADSFRSLFKIIWDKISIIPEGSNHKPQGLKK